jgi:hypothetical protein
MPFPKRLRLLAYQERELLPSESFVIRGERPVHTMSWFSRQSTARQRLANPESAIALATASMQTVPDAPTEAALIAARTVFRRPSCHVASSPARISDVSFTIQSFTGQYSATWVCAGETCGGNLCLRNPGGTGRCGLSSRSIGGLRESEGVNNRRSGDHNEQRSSLPLPLYGTEKRLSLSGLQKSCESELVLGVYNEMMNCQIKDELVSQLIVLNNKLNLLSPDLVEGEEERAEVQRQRESLYAEIKQHRAKGHEGKPCPAARQV